MKLHKDAPHKRALVHSRSGTNWPIRGFKFHYVDESQNSDLSRNNASHTHRRMVRGSDQPRRSAGAFGSRRGTSMFAWRDLLCGAERNTFELRPYRAPRAPCASFILLSRKQAGSPTRWTHRAGCAGWHFRFCVWLGQQPGQKAQGRLPLGCAD